MTRAQAGVRAAWSPAARVVVPVAAALAVVALLLAAATQARWFARASFTGGVVTAGDLDLTVDPEIAWEQLTPGVTPSASGTLGSPPEGFVSMPGDVIAILLGATTALQGDNLTALLTVEVDDTSGDIAGGLVEVSYTVVDDDGAVHGQRTPAGSSVVVDPALLGSDDGNEARWWVVLRVDVLGDYAWSPGDQPFGDPAQWAAGHVVLRLDQVRTGADDEVGTGAPPGGGAR